MASQFKKSLDRVNLSNRQSILKLGMSLNRKSINSIKPRRLNKCHATHMSRQRYVKEELGQKILRVAKNNTEFSANKLDLKTRKNYKPITAKTKSKSINRKL